MPAFSPSFSAQCGESVPAIWSEVAYSPSSFSRTPASSGSTLTRNSPAAGRPEPRFHSHLWPMAQMLRFTFLRIGDAAQRRRHHVAVLEGGDEFGALVGIVPQPVQQLGESPLRRIDSAAPVDRFQPFAMRGFGDLRGFAFGAVIAPQIVFAERLQVLADGNHGRAGGIERDGLDLIAGDAGFLHRLARGRGQGAHVIFVRLGGVFGIFAFAMQRIFGDRGGAAARARCPRWRRERSEFRNRLPPRSPSAGSR